MIKKHSKRILETSRFVRSDGLTTHDYVNNVPLHTFKVSIVSKKLPLWIILRDQNQILLFTMRNVAVYDFPALSTNYLDLWCSLQNTLLFPLDRTSPRLNCYFRYPPSECIEPVPRLNRLTSIRGGIHFLNMDALRNPVYQTVSLYDPWFIILTDIFLGFMLFAFIPDQL